MDPIIPILHLEDDPMDAELIQARLEEAGLACRITRVQTRDEFEQALRRDAFDIILADYRLPMYDGLSALQLVLERFPDVPFIFVTGAMGEEAAVEALTKGATDYVLKQALTRLGSAVKRALQEAQNRRERKLIEEERRSHLWFLECMDKINRAIQGASDLERMLSDALDVVIEIFDCDRAWLVYPCDPEATSWQVPMERTKPEYPGAMSLGQEIPLEEDVARTFRIVLAADDPVRFDPESDHPLPENNSEQFGYKSFLSMAIYPKLGKSWEFGLHQCSYARVWTPLEERLLQEIGRRLSDALTTFLVHRHLRESEERYRKLYTQTPAMLHSIDRQGRLLSVSDHWLAKMGFSHQEVLGRSLLEFITRQSRRYVQEMVWPEFFKTGTCKDVPYQFVTKDGRVLDILLSATSERDESGEAIKFLSALEDITERNQAQEALRARERELQTLVENLPDMIARFHKDGRYIYVSPSVTKGFGKPKEYFLGKTVKEVLADATDRNESLNDLISQAWEQGIPNSCELAWRVGDEERFVEIRHIPEMDGYGQVASVLGITRDVTERKRAEMENKKRQEELIRADRMISLGILVAGVAHEINNPNNTIVLNTPLLTRAWKEIIPFIDTYYDTHGDFKLAGMLYSKMRKHIPEMLEEIIAGSRRIEQIITHLKDYARQSPTELIEEVDVNHVIRTTLSLLSPQLKNATRSLKVELGEGLPRLKGNFVRLEQVLVNLIQNSCQALPDPGKGIFIRSGHHKADKMVEVIVRDEGVGINSTIHKNIFDPFFTSKREQGGVGLGLSICLTIIKEHGGTLDIVSEVDQGTKAVIRLPVPV